MTDHTIALTFKVPQAVLLDLLTTCYEGGSAYWLACDYPDRDGDSNVTRIRGCIDAENGEKVGDGEVTPATMLLGLQRIADGTMKINSHTRSQVLALLADNESTDWDGDTADCVLQGGMFGELVYG